MRSWAIFAVGGISGLAVGLLLNIGSNHADQGLSGPKTPTDTAQLAAATTSTSLPERRPTPSARPNASSSLNPTFSERIRVATQTPTPAPTTRVQKSPELLRLNSWLAENDFSEAQQEEITAGYLAAIAESPEDPFARGSSFDEWMRGELAVSDIPAWDGLQSSHEEELVERRTNILFSGLQEALALTTEQKDVLYQEIASTVRDDLPRMSDGTVPSGQGMAEMVASHLERLEEFVPEDQYGALETWLADQLPALWLEEGTPGPESD